VPPKMENKKFFFAPSFLETPSHIIPYNILSKNQILKCNFKMFNRITNAHILLLSSMFLGRFILGFKVGILKIAEN
jgi:hypothetical protein